MVRSFLFLMMCAGAVLCGERPEASLAMVSGEQRVVLKVKDGSITSATVNGAAIPLDRVKREGAGLKVVDEKGVVLGAMAQLPTEGPAALKPMVPVFTDNPGLRVEIVNNRELRVTENGKAVPAAQLRMEDGELRIFNAAGDLLRIIPADAARLEKR